MGKKLKKTNFGPDAYGKHLTIDAYGIAAAKLRDSKSIKKLLNFLPGYFGMSILRRAVLHKVQSEEYPNWGLSGFVLLYESHISVHTWPEIGYVSMDVYSCRDFEHKKVVDYLKNYWQCKELETRVIKRVAKTV
jgi:S-adenosylmethionine decarboxylase